jgi:menaquinone-dependent protoporphyrinogen oxidase
VSRVLVAYATKHGATKEIADAIADQLRQRGHSVDCRSADTAGSLDDYDGAVIGSAVYMKRWRPEARRLLKREAKILKQRPFWVFSSGPCGDNPDPSWSEPTRIVRRAVALGVRAHVVFGGRLPLDPDGFVERAMVENCPPDKRDLRDWDAIRSWADGVGAELSQPTAR